MMLVDYLANSLPLQRPAVRTSPTTAMPSKPSLSGVPGSHMSDGSTAIKSTAPSIVPFITHIRAESEGRGHVGIVCLNSVYNSSQN